MKLITYDIESYANYFCATFKALGDDRLYKFEAEQFNAMWDWMHRCTAAGFRFVGFNNVGYDHVVLSKVAEQSESVTPELIYRHSVDTITSGRWGDKGSPDIPQIDLYLINHFDNPAKATSLKDIEFAMGSYTIEELPYPPETVLTDEQKKEVLEYNVHDVLRTEDFLRENLSAIELRDSLYDKFGLPCINYNDTKIGKQFFLSRLRDKGIQTFNVGTPRDTIAIRDLILPGSSTLQTPQFRGILEDIAGRVIPGSSTKGLFKGLSTPYAGLDFNFGLGGLHASLSKHVLHSDDQWVIVDKDVTSYYPSLIIAYHIAPEHFGRAFSDEFKTLKELRLQYEKGTPENAVFKLSLNGSFGDTGSSYSSFYDPAAMLKVTINGQLMLAKLVEMLTNKLPALMMIQANTDGITYILPHSQKRYADEICHEWEQLVMLDLEEAIYSSMYIRDVNNYIAIKENGDMKLKGAYEIDRPWYKDHSQLIVPAAVKANIVDNTDPLEFLRFGWDCDPRNFAIRARVKFKKHQMIYRNPFGDSPMGKVTRYVVSPRGGELIKVMPPLKGKAGNREVREHAGYLSTVCNNLDNLPTVPDWGYYMKEVEKLLWWKQTSDRT